MQFIQSFAEAFLQLLVIGLLILLTGYSLKHKDQRFLIVFCLLFLLDAIIVGSLNISVVAGQKWNWIGKSGSLLWIVIFIFTTRLLTKKDVGWTLSIINPKGVLIIIAVILFGRLAIRLFFQGFNSGYNIETFIYEATLPGIAEEIVFRGILLGLLNKVFLKRWIVLRTFFGKGLIVTSILFGLVHGLSLNRSWIPDLNSQRFIMTGAMGFAFGIVKEKSKSLIPGILFHNLWNIIAYWGK
jgi:membrane protease YdiL (CAAX protease family)